MVNHSRPDFLASEGAPQMQHPVKQHDQALELIARFERAFLSDAARTHLWGPGGESLLRPGTLVQEKRGFGFIQVGGTVLMLWRYLDMGHEQDKAIALRWVYGGSCDRVDCLVALIDLEPSGHLGHAIAFGPHASWLLERYPGF